jgi:hypothetical protein
MAKRRYCVYYADESDEENNQNVPQARVISVQRDGRRIVESARSPHKRGVIRKSNTLPVHEWEPSADFGAGFIEPLTFDNGLDSGDEEVASGPAIVAKAAAKRYPTSARSIQVSHHSCSHSRHRINLYASGLATMTTQDIARSTFLKTSGWKAAGMLKASSTAQHVQEPQ